MKKWKNLKNVERENTFLDKDFLGDIRKMKSVMKQKFDLSREPSDADFTHLLRRQQAWRNLPGLIDTRRFMENE